MDFVQEDLDSMQKELDMWKKEHKDNLLALQREQRYLRDCVQHFLGLKKALLCILLTLTK